MHAGNSPRRLFLIRHAPVEIDLAMPSDRWQLSAEGETAAAQLAELPIWGSLDAIYSSTEPKAQATAGPLANRFRLPVIADADLDELRRGLNNIAGEAAYQAAVRRAFAEPERGVAGWESAAAAQRRIRAGVGRLAARHVGSIAIISHGLVLSLLSAHLMRQPRVDFAAWRALPMPALAIVDPDHWQFVLPFRSPAHWKE